MLVLFSMDRIIALLETETLRAGGSSRKAFATRMGITTPCSARSIGIDGKVLCSPRYKAKKLLLRNIPGKTLLPRYLARLDDLHERILVEDGNAKLLGLA